jgi:hypothetical protein
MKRGARLAVVRHLIAAVGAATIVLAFTGCLPLTIAAAVDYDQKAKAGLVPPMSLVRKCNQDGLERDASGRWQMSKDLTAACYREGGWEMSDKSGAWAWRKVGEGQ